MGDSWFTDRAKTTPSELAIGEHAPLAYYLNFHLYVFRQLCRGELTIDTQLDDSMRYIQWVSVMWQSI